MTKAKSIWARMRGLASAVDRGVTREGFVDVTAGVIGIATTAIGLSLVLFPELFFKSGAWRLVFETAQPWAWALVIIPCGVLIMLAAANEKKLAIIPTFTMSVVFVMMGVMLTLAASPVGVITFGALSILSSMVFRVYLRDYMNDRHVPAP